MKKVVLFFALAVGLLASAATVQAQTVNTSRYITLTVSNGEVIKLDFKAAAANTSVRIKSGITDTTITVGTSWKGITSYTAADSVMTVYGDIIVFYCSNNRAKLTAIDLSHHTQLTELYCTNNKITSLDVSNNTQLTGLYCTSNQLSSLNASGCTQLKTLNCVSNQLLSLNVSGCTQLTKVECFSNRLSSLDVSGYTQLKELNCHGNQLSNINVSGCTQLKELKCYNNQLASLNISGCTQLKELYCYNNILTALDVSGCTQLTKVYCHDNKLSTDALDDIYCALPDRKDSINGVIQPVDNSSSTYNDTVIASNAANATTKNWRVQYYSNDADIATTGSYVCGTPHTVDTSRYITLTVAKDSAISLDLMAAAAGTPIRIVSGSNTQDITVGTNWYNGNFPSTFTVTAAASTMTIYGDIIGFRCSYNGANLTALDPSHNTQLTELYCGENNLSSLDISNNTQLTELGCGINNLSNLDVSHNTQLTGLWCNGNELSSLDVSHNTQLKILYCFGNAFTTAALDDIYCALPNRTGKDNGEIYTLRDTSSVAEQAIVEATNASNATAKNWKVRKYNRFYNPVITTTGTYVCGTVHLDTYITLTVKSGEEIKLKFKAAAAGTPVKIVSGSRDTTFTVDNDWMTHYVKYKSDGTTMTVYGTITGFICDGNGTNLTALDPSHNTQLTTLYCHGNNFSTQAIDDIFCALPDRTGKGNGVIDPVLNSSDPNHATVLATNKTNAINKNWKVQYYDDNTDIPATTGSYVCSAPEPNMNSYITLTVKKDSAIKLDFIAAAATTPIRIVSGSNTQDIIVGTNWKGTASYTAGSTTMTVYGDIIGFDCSGNGANLTALDVSNNTQLTELDCDGNNLSSLDVSGCTQLTELGCRDNKLTDLDVSHNTQLKALSCGSNNFTTAALDDIYCALPDRNDSTNGVIYPIYDSSSSDTATVKATNAQNAISKNWEVRYYRSNTDIPATTGTYTCPTTDIAEASAEQALTLYPNPVADVLYLSATARTIRVYDIYGTEVAHAYDTDRVEVSHLPAGIYTVKADGMVAKMVKR